jgi:hypothetical protein
VSHDLAEAEAMRAFYAQPATRKPYLSTDADAYRDGLLRQAQERAQG